jgi:hypothetical protein
VVYLRLASALRGVPQVSAGCVLAKTDALWSELKVVLLRLPYGVDARVCRAAPRR